MQTDGPEVTGVSSLNELARQRGWPVQCDAECAFTFAPLYELLAIWRGKAGPAGIPFRRHMTARVLKPFLKMMALHERVPGPDGTRQYRVRLMGEDITDIAGAASGKFYGDFLPAQSVLVWNAMTDAVLCHGAPVRMVIRADELDKPYLVGELFAAPLLADDGSASIVLTAGRFKGDHTFEEVVAGARR